MEITLETLAVNTRLLKVQISPRKVGVALDEYYAQLAPKAKVSGFRPGKVPRNVLEKNFQENAKEEVEQKAIPMAYREVMQEKQLRVAMSPLLKKVEWLQDGSLYFEMQIDLVPDFTLPAYQGIAVELSIPAVTDKDVEESVDRLRDKHAQLVPLTGRGLRLGDMVIMDQKVSAGDQLLEESKDLMCALDEKRLAPEMIRELLDGKAGDNKVVCLKIPEHYPKKEWIGKPATIHLAIKEIKEKRLPEASDEFAQDVGEYENMANLRGKIRESLEKYREEMIRLQTESKINEFLLKNVRMDLPERLVERQKRHMHESAVEKKHAPEHPNEAYWQALKDRAIDRLKLYFVHMRIAKDQKMDITQQEIDEKIGQIAGSIGQGLAVVREYYQKKDHAEDLRERIQLDRVADFLVSKAKVKNSG